MRAVLVRSELEDVARQERMRVDDETNDLLRAKAPRGDLMRASSNSAPLQEATR